MTLQVIAIDDVKPDEPRRYYPAHAIPDLDLTALTKANELDGPLHLRPWNNVNKGEWVAIVDRPAPPPSLDLEAIGARLRDALGYWTARGSRSIIDGSKADDPIGDALTPWGHVARVALSIDRPAPTPTPTPGLDLDAVERAERAMTPGPWRHGSVERHHVFCSEGDRSLLCPEAGRVLLRMNEHFPHDSDAAGIVALRNAAPALIAEVRALRGKLAEAHSLLRSAGDLFVEIQATDGEDEHKAITDGAKLSAAIAAALEAL